MWPKRVTILLVAIIGVQMFGPREPVDLTISFSPVELGADLDAYLARSEGWVTDLNPDHAKSIIWAGAKGAKTAKSIVYIHGFSATKEEIRPVPDKIAAALGANLYFARLAGHGRTNEAMAQGSVNAWMNDVAEAIAIGARLGDEVIVIATSTGGTLFSLYAFDPVAIAPVAGVVFMSPNFGIQAGGSQFLTWPFARQVVPLIAGAERSWEPINDRQEMHWATRYPTVATLPMAAAVKLTLDLPVEDIALPAMFIYSPDDQVVSPEATARIADRWGGPVERWVIPGAEVGDPSAHVLAGDIVSAQTTDVAVDRVLAWIGGL